MDTAVIERVIHALDLVYGSDTPIDQRREAEAVCEQLRNDPLAPAYGFHLTNPTNLPMVRHFGLQVIEHAIRHRWGSTPALDVQGCQSMRDQVLGLLLNLGDDDKVYIREKLVSILVMLVIRAWLSPEWTNLSEQLMQLYSLSPVGREMALSVWRTLGEELFVYDRDPVATIRKSQLTSGIVGALLPKPVVVELYPSGYRLSSDPVAATAAAGKKSKAVSLVVLEPGNEEGWLLRWAQYASELSSAKELNDTQEAQLVAAIDTIAVYLDWIPIRALISTRLIPLLASTLLVHSDAVRRRASEALETISRRNTASGEDRDTVLLLMAHPDALGPIAQAYGTTLPQSAGSCWEDSSEALVVARTLSAVCANLVTMHWTRKKTETSVLPQPERLIELLVAMSRDARYTVAAPVLGCWGTGILKHAAVARVPQVAAAFGALTEHATQALFGVCRASHALQSGKGAAGVDEDEAAEFESVAELRGFLSGEVRGRLLGIVRGMCQIDPAGFVGWILPSLVPVFTSGSGDQPMAVIEAAFMIVDSVLAALDEFEQHALEESDHERIDQVQRARAPCYELGRLVVQFACPQDLAVRHLSTLPSFAFLLRPTAINDGVSRDLLMAVLQKCASCLHGSSADLVVARRASAALVRIAMTIPDSLMLIYADLSQLVQGLIADLGVSPSVKSYLREFQLALIAGATTCSLPERKALAQPVIQPMVQSLKALSAVSLQSPTAFIEFLGLPQLDQAFVGGANPDEEARKRRGQLSATLSTLYICLNRTLGDSDRGLVAVWSDYVDDLVQPLLLLVRCIHALWNPAHWQHLPWQSAQACDRLFGIAADGISSGDVPPGAEKKEARDIQNSLAVLRGHTYRCLGKLVHLPELVRGPEMATNFTGCLFADAQSLTARHWRLLLVEVMRPILRTVGNWPGHDSGRLEAVAEFIPVWLAPLFAFCTGQLGNEWAALNQRNSQPIVAGDVSDEIARDAAIRDWTRAWSQLLSELLLSIMHWIPDATQIEHDLMSSARVSIDQATKPQGNPALGTWLLRTPDMLAATLTACLSALGFSDTQAVNRVVLLLASLMPSLSLIAVVPLYEPPTPALASTVSGYTSRLDPSMTGSCSGIFAWLVSDCVGALTSVLRDPLLIDVQDHVLSGLADMVYFSASIVERMPVSWSFRQSSGIVGDPGKAFRLAITNSLMAGLGVSVEDCFAQIAGESEPKRRRALLRVTLQGALAVEKSKLFEDKAKPAKPKYSNGESLVDESWSNKLAGHNASVLDNDDHFDLALLLP
ncbi:karyopherin [Coemansia sp. RSA 2050]|nr:karyopherin [Coemansia sp. RSA 2050]KAJ2732485.1 karyopherin [Coemansia sp. BCRC 34962]